MDPSRWFFYRLVGIVSIIKLVAMLVKEIRAGKWDRERNFEWYKGAYPGHVGEDWVKCHNCSSRTIHIRDVAKTLKAFLNSHVCAHCGLELYRSKTLR